QRTTLKAAEQSRTEGHQGDFNSSEKISDSPSHKEQESQRSDCLLLPIRDRVPHLCLAPSGRSWNGDTSTLKVTVHHGQDGRNLNQPSTSVPPSAAERNGRMCALCSTHLAELRA
ncbi:mCG144518, partial [Mus musculus]